MGRSNHRLSYLHWPIMEVKKRLLAPCLLKGVPQRDTDTKRTCLPLLDRRHHRQFWRDGALRLDDSGARSRR